MSTVVRKRGFDLLAGDSVSGDVPDKVIVEPTLLCEKKKQKVFAGPTLVVTSRYVLVRRRHNTESTELGVTLGATAEFEGHGTFARSTPDVDFYRAGHRLAFDGVDNVFAGGALRAGIALTARGVAASANANDDGKTAISLTLAGGGEDVAVDGTPVVERILSIGLDLDVFDAQPLPVALTDAEKELEGRHVQTPVAGYYHLRAKVRVRPPRPFVAGTVRLARANGAVALYADEVPADGQVPVALARQIAAADARDNAQVLWMQGVTVGNAALHTGLTLGFTPADEADLLEEGDMATVTVVAISLRNPDLAVRTGFGMWDQAFNHLGALYNLLAEADNFVGADLERFQIRVEDAAPPGTHVTATWHTLDAANQPIDAPGDATVTLPASAARQFSSRGLMLVNDAIDKAQGTHSGLGLGLPDANAARAAGQSNHRLRRGDMAGSVVAEYALRHGRARVRVPVFLPAALRRMRVHAFVVRAAPDDGTVVSADVWTNLRVLRETYARFGILVELPFSPVVRGNPANRTQGEFNVKIVNPPPEEDYGAWDPDEVSLGTLGALAMLYKLDVNGDGEPSDAIDMRNLVCLFVRRLAEIETDTVPMRPGGLSFTHHAFGDHAKVGTAVCGAGVGPYVAAHELGHILTDKPSHLNTGHFAQPGGGGHRYFNDHNLMKRQFLGAEAVAGPQRLWPVEDAHGGDQVGAIRESGYLRDW